MNEYPIGDVSYEDGDYDDGETGDVARAPARRNPITKNTVQSPARLAAKLIRRQPQSPITSQPARRTDAQVQNIARMKMSLQSPQVLFIGCKGLEILTTSLGPNKALKEAEKKAVQAAVFDAVPFSQQVFGFTSGVLNVDSVLSTGNAGPLAPATNFRYAGSILTLAASVLNATPGQPVSAVIELGTGFSLTLLFKIQEGVKAAEMMVLNAVMANGEPRFYAPTVPVATTTSGNYTYTITGLPSDYTPSLRFLMPGDRSVDNVLALLS